MPGDRGRAGAPGELHVRGGAGGIAARLGDLVQAGAVLRSVAAELADRGRAVLAVAADPGLQLTGPISPRTFARAELLLGSAVTGPDGLLRLAARTESLGVAVAAAAEAYRVAEATAAVGLRIAAFQAGRTVGLAGLLAAPGRLVHSVSAAEVVTVLLGAGHLAGHIVDAGDDRGDDRGDGQRGDRPTLPESLGRLGGLTVRLLTDHAGLVATVIPAVPGVINGAGGALPGGRLLLEGVFGRPGAPFSGTDIATGLGVVGGLTGGAGVGHPWLREGGPARVRVLPAHPSRPAADLGQVVGRIPAPSLATGRIQVERVDGPQGRRWVVELPGTSDWSPGPTRTPFDLSGDVELAAGRRSTGMSAVVESMRQVGVGRGEPVLLVGHSQGGLIAAELAADPQVRREFRVSHVLTTGAPVASIQIPGDVQVLSVEHSDDLVPKLDGASNRDRPNWVTVSTVAPVGEVTPASARSEPLVAHRLDLYQRTVERIDASDDPSIRAWRQGVAPFLDGPGRHATAWTVELTRVGTS